MKSVSPCPNCGFTHHCLCAEIPTIDSSMLFSLLMHEKEYERPTNTGKWLAKMLPSCHTYRWQRLTPSAEFAARLALPEYRPLIVFPDDDQGLSLEEACSRAHCHGQQPHFIILDGTWQEARKMNRKSHWLDHYERVQIHTTQPSEYPLRRNQQDGALCTMEIAQAILSQSGETHQALQMQQFFRLLMMTYQADRQGLSIQI